MRGVQFTVGLTAKVFCVQWVNLGGDPGTLEDGTGGALLTMMDFDWNEV